MPRSVSPWVSTDELSFFDAASGRSLKGIVGPEVFGVAALQFFFNRLITGGPKTGEVLGDLNGSSGWREQMNENGDFAAHQAGRVALSEYFLETDSQNGNLT